MSISPAWKCDCLRARRLKVALGVTLILAVLPILPCPGKWCRDDYQMWMNAANNPQADPHAAAAVRQWAETHGCRLCNNTGWVSGLRWRWVQIQRELEHWYQTGHVHCW